MFQQLKKVLGQGKTDGKSETADRPADLANLQPDADMSINADLGAMSADVIQNSSLGAAGSGTGSSIRGMVNDKPWKLERAAASRNYIAGEEIRGRADIGIDPLVSVIIMNRPLQERLEKRAYAIYTDSNETEASPTLMEEMRWLALYPQVGWERIADSFWHRYAVMTSHRTHAMNWLTPKLADMLVTWPEPAPLAKNPFILMVMRGRVHLRMQFTPPDASTLDYVTRVFTAASQAAFEVFPANPAKSASSSRE